jgi:TIR domain
MGDIDKTRRAHGHHHVFMSYSWKRKEEADYVEAFLIRNPRITLFRDEEEIQTGEPISDRIRNQLRKCDVFLVLWCAEYAASPRLYGCGTALDAVAQS